MDYEAGVVTTCRIGRLSFNKDYLLCGFNRFGGARFGTGTAISALRRIDHVNGITFTDRINRTLRHTGTTRKTGIINLMSHEQPPLRMKLFE